jgi:NADH:ubiquinone reductase (non-electrogenic)
MSKEERERFLNFVIVGGGPTSCEFAGELAEFIEKDARQKYPELVEKAKVTIINKAKQVLPSYATDIQAYTAKEFAKDGITIINETYVEECRRDNDGSDRVKLSNGDELKFGLLVWSTGVETLPFIKKLDIPKDEKTGRVLTDSKLMVKGVKNVYSIGDCAMIEGQYYPPIA